MTLNELNNKIWYRLVKVVYNLLFISLVAYGLVTIYSNHSGMSMSVDRTTINCKLGIKRTITAREAGVEAKDINNFTMLEKACGITPEEVEEAKRTFISNFKPKSAVRNDLYSQIVNDPEIAFRHSNPEMTTRFVDEYKTDWERVIYSMLILLVLIGLAYELIRRLFYYVMLGSIKPMK